MTATSSRRAVRVAIAATVAALLGAASLAAPAHAATPDSSRNGSSSLTIHKYDGAPQAAHNGTELPTEPNLPGLNGVEFTVQRVAVGGTPLDLGTNAGWVAAEDLYEQVGSNPTAADLSAAGATLGSGTTGVTAGGTATTAAITDFTGLAFGLYYVTETSYPAGTTPAAPFLVSVPLTHPTDLDSWIYDVHVYPKNSVSGVEKEVEDSADIKLGDEIEFTITADTPDVDVIDGYKVVDDLDPKLDYVGAAVTLTNGTPLIAGTDYTVTPATATAGGPQVEVVFTAAGRAKLVDNRDAQVVVVLTTTVNTVGEIVNTALLYPNQASFDVTPGDPGGPNTPENPVVTKWGGITLNKTNSADDAALAGAKFQVYAGTTADFSAAAPVTVPGVAVENGGSVWTSAADGQVAVDGLRYSTWANNAAVSAGQPGYIYYWLVEVEAPAGFELLPEPIAFEVNSAATAQTVNVENVPSNSGFQLPFTGGVGVTWLYAAGGFLVAGALLLTARNRRKQQV